MKFNSDYFYNSHKLEIQKILNTKSSYLHIVHENSNISSDIFENVLKINNEFDIKKELSKKDKSYDVIIVTDIFELNDDIYKLIKIISSFLNLNGKLVLSSINPKWHFIIKIFEYLNLKNKTYIKSYIKPNKIQNILKSQNFTKISTFNKLNIPVFFFGIGHLINLVIDTMFPFFNLGIRNYMIFSKSSDSKKITSSKSILVPAKNEEGNLEELIERIPFLGSDVEIIIICGESKDNTYKVAKNISNNHKERNIKVIKQTKNGKANAIWEGLDICNNELIAILDSDLSVDPETLPSFFEIVEHGFADFVNGTRLIYKMEDGAMRGLNKIGNISFQFLISKLIGVNLSDSLCGTKVFKKNDIEFIKNWQDKMYFNDPFCDFDLIFSAAYAKNRIIEYPVHYRSRKYGKTNISRFRDGWKLIFYFINSYFLIKTNLNARFK